MGKNRRKPSATQRDKYWIGVAKILKENGIISKQAKLHGGRFISKEVLRKAKDFEATARLNYTAVKVDKTIAQAAKERGFQVVQGNRIVGPKTPTFRNRLKSGALTGVKPVKGGMMEEVVLPHTIYDMQTLINALEDGGIDSLKMANEQFAFKYRGNESYRAFMNSEDLLKYLQHYKGIQTALVTQKPEELKEQFESFSIFRLHRADISRNLPTMEQRRKRYVEKRAQAIRDGNYIVRRNKTKTRSERLANLPDWKVDKILDKAAEYDRARRKRLLDNPEKLAKYKADAIRRALASRERTKK